jgi:hypothetical protein
MCRQPQPRTRRGPVDVMEERGNVLTAVYVGFDPIMSSSMLPDALMRTHGWRCRFPPCQAEHFLSKPSLSTGIDKRPVGGPQTHDKTHRGATGRTSGDAGFWGYDLSRLERDGVALQDHATRGVGWDSTASMQKAEVSDFHEAIG